MPLSLSPQAARLLSAPVRTKKRLMLFGGLILIVAAVLFMLHRQRHVTENDARVMADMVTISSRVDGWVAQRRVTVTVDQQIGITLQVYTGHFQRRRLLV